MSLLLLKKPSSLQEFLCPIQGTCDVVLKSSFASVSGVPLSLVGMIFYLCVLGLILLTCAVASQKLRGRLLEGILWLLVAGFTFSTGLMYLQFGVLHAFCRLCTSSFLILGATLFAVATVKRRAAAETWVAVPGMALSLALFAAFPTAIFLSTNFGPVNSSMWIDLSMAHQQGPPAARVQVAVFSDFQCPFCRLLEPTLLRIRQRFPQDVVLVFRSFPLDVHPRAFPAAEAAECAAEQGKFWEYHDQLFAAGEDLSDARLTAFAGAVGLDTARFAECLKSGRMKSRVEASRREAMSHGLEGVPALFINGHRVEDGLDYEHLAKRIEKLIQTDSLPAQ